MTTEQDDRTKWIEATHHEARFYDTGATLTAVVASVAGLGTVWLQGRDLRDVLLVLAASVALRFLLTLLIYWTWTRRRLQWIDQQYPPPK
jgi:hypothetical protein